MITTYFRRIWGWIRVPRRVEPIVKPESNFEEPPKHRAKRDGQQDLDIYA